MQTSRLLKSRVAALATPHMTQPTRAMTTVDVHTHFLPLTWPDWAKKYGGEAPWPWMQPNEGGDSSRAMLMQGSTEFRPVHYACWDVPKRLADMAKDKIDHQLISATPILFQWHRPAAESLDVAMHFNDAALEMCATAGKNQLSALCQVPLQDLDLACREATRACKENGCVGVQIGNHHGAWDLDHPQLLAFLKHCAAENIAVLVHPWDMMDCEDRLSRYMMKWTVGMPMETQLSIAALILSGSFDVLPPELKIMFAHGGGSFSFLLGRLENAYIHRDVARGTAKHPPSHYLNRFATDSAVFDERALRCLVDTMSSSRVMLGSDYPFPLGEDRIGSLVRNASFLPEADKAAILGGNAIDFFGLDIKP